MSGDGRRGDVALGAIIAMAARWKGTLKVGWLLGPAFVGAIIAWGLIWRALNSDVVIVALVLLAVVGLSVAVLLAGDRREP